MIFIFLMIFCFQANIFCASNTEKEWVIFENNSEQQSLELDKKFLKTELFQAIKRVPENDYDKSVNDNNKDTVTLVHINFDDIKTLHDYYKKNLIEWNFKEYINVLNIYDTGGDTQNFLYNYYQKVTYWDPTKRQSKNSFSDVEKIYRRILLSIRKTSTDDLRKNTLQTIQTTVNSEYLKSNLHDFVLFTIAKRNPRNFSQHFLNSCERIDLSWLGSQNIELSAVEDVQQIGNWQCVTLNNNKRNGSYWFGLKNVDGVPGIVLYNPDKNLFFSTNRYRWSNSGQFIWFISNETSYCFDLLSDTFLDIYSDTLSIQDIFSEDFFVTCDLTNKKLDFRIKNQEAQSFSIIKNEYHEHNNKRYTFIKNKENDKQEGLLIFGNPVYIIYFSKDMKIGEYTFREFFKAYGIKGISYENNSLIIKSDHTGNKYVFTILNDQKNSDAYFNIGTLDENHENFNHETGFTVCGGGTTSDTEHHFTDFMKFYFWKGCKFGFETSKELSLKFENQKDTIPLTIENFSSNKIDDHYSYTLQIGDCFYNLSSFTLINYLKTGNFNENNENNLTVDDFFSKDYDKNYLDKSEDELDEIDKDADDQDKEDNILLFEKKLKENSDEIETSKSNYIKPILVITIPTIICLLGLYFRNDIKKMYHSYKTKQGPTLKIATNNS